MMEKLADIFIIVISAFGVGGLITLIIGIIGTLIDKRKRKKYNINNFKMKEEK